MPSVREAAGVLPELARVNTIAVAVSQLTEDYKRKVAVVERITQQLERAKEEKDAVSAAIDVQEKAQAILLALEENWRKDFERGIEQVITEGLEIVFGKGLAFHIDTNIRAGASSITFEVETPTAQTEIQDAEGGSLVQVVSFLLRLILIKASRPAMRQVVVLDEAFAGIDEDNVPLVALLVRKMADDSDVQVIMVTHDRHYMEVADKVFEIYRHKGTATARELEAV